MIKVREIIITTIAILIFFNPKIGFSQEIKQTINFTDNDGMPQNKIKALLYDSTHYVWIGTQNGVAKYDGYAFRNYKELTGKEVIKIHLSSSNDLWIGTHRGLFRLDRTKDQFEIISLGDIRDIAEANHTLYFITPEKLFKLQDDQVVTLYTEDERILRQLTCKDQHIYMGLGKGGGIYEGREFDNQLIKTKEYLKGKVVTTLKIINNRLWVGNSDGSIYHSSGDGFEQIVLPNRYNIKDLVAQKNSLWIATDGNGLFEWDLQKKVSKHFYFIPGEKSLIRSNNIQGLMSISENDLWVGTYDAGLFYLNSKQSIFETASNLIKDHVEQLNIGEIATSCFEDSSSNIWIGTSAGFGVINHKTGHFTTKSYQWCQQHLKGSKVLSIQESANGEIWAGTYDGGLGRLSKSGDLISTYFPFSQGNPKEQNINFIVPRKDGKLLLSSMYESLGLFDYQQNRLQKIPYIINGDTSMNYQTQAVRHFNNKIYAYIYNRGLCLLDEASTSLRPLFNPPSPINDLIINEDKSFWMATRGSGLILMDKKGNVLSQKTMQDGLSSNFPLRIEKDPENNLWVTSISGLTKITPEGSMTIYDHRHGLPSKEFTPFTSTKLSDGELLFGTVKGLVKTNLDAQQGKLAEPQVIISDISFQNRSIKEVAPELLDRPVESLKEVTLPYTLNSFTVHFFNDDYNLPKYNTFQYRMIGLEDTWINLNENTRTTYTNLLPGKYEFQVKSANKFGHYGTEFTQLSITILPPWYLSKFALTCYVILTIALIYAIYQIMLYRTHTKKELEFSEYRINAMKELNENKLKFFTNITHDFKTPLTLISAPLDSLLKDQQINEKAHRNLTLIKRNADRLHHLIIDLLDFRKTSNSHNLKLEVSETDSNRFIEDLFEPFSSACHTKNITLTVSNKCDEPIYFDNEKVKRIMWNLLSNALKFTPQDGNIHLFCEISPDTQNLLLSVQDSGKGMAQEDMDHLFERYYQGKTDYEWSDTGTGLGMAIVNGLVNSHRGKIAVSSSEAGTRFTVSLPYKKSDYAEDELVDKPRGNYQFLPTTEKDISVSENTNHAKNLPVILIAEDNVELNNFLTSLLTPAYKVISCFDGKSALDLAHKKNIDLILTDVMMPNMNGYELCEAIKTNLNTSHIPVILLTANSSLEEQVKGMSQGADTYITKPFKEDFLLASINSLIENRKKLREKFQNLEKPIETSNELSEQDNKFMKDLGDFIEKNLNNEGLSIDDVADAMNCSKSSLTRKVRALTNLTPMALIRNHRLNQAYELLTKQKVTVSEASYKTGFSDPNYFTTCFKKQFGVNPSQI